MARGLEPELSAVADVMFPMVAITEAAREFATLFPATLLRLQVEAMGATYTPVLDGRCSLGVVGPLLVPQPSLTSERPTGIEMVMVAACGHALASIGAVIPARRSPGTCNWGSPTVRTSRPAASSASCRSRPGAWRTCSPSTLSC